MCMESTFTSFFHLTNPLLKGSKKKQQSKVQQDNLPTFPLQTNPYTLSTLSSFHTLSPHTPHSLS